DDPSRRTRQNNRTARRRDHADLLDFAGICRCPELCSATLRPAHALERSYCELHSRSIAMFSQYSFAPKHAARGFHRALAVHRWWEEAQDRKRSSTESAESVLDGDARNGGP